MENNKFSTRKQNGNESNSGTSKKTNETNFEVTEILKTQKISQIIIHGGSEKFNKEKKQIELPLTPDLDAQSASYLLSLIQNKKGEPALYKEGARSSIVPKGGSEKDLKEEDRIEEGVIVYIDTGNKWLEVEKDGNKTKIYFDHHGEERRSSTSATKMIYDTFSKNYESIPWLKDYVKAVTSFDNLDYLNMKDKEGKKIFNEEYFKNTWPYTLNHLAKYIDIKILMDLFKVDEVKSFNQSIKKSLNKKVEIGGKTGKLGDLIKTNNGKSINELLKQETTENPNNNINKTIKGIEKADKFDSKELGKVVFHNYKRNYNTNGNGYQFNTIPDHLAFIGTKASGNDTYVAWNKEKDKDYFFINSNEIGLKNIISNLRARGVEVINIRGVMVKGKIGDLTEEEFIAILKGEEFLNTHELKIQEYIKKIEVLEKRMEKKAEEIAKLEKEISEMI